MRIKKGKFLILISSFFLLNFRFAAADSGSIHGFVKFPGETPPTEMFANREASDCPHGILQNHLIVDQRRRGLKNAVILLESDDRIDPVDRRATLSSDDCTLVPRIQSALIGTSLTLTSHGGAAHRIHAYRNGATAFVVDLTEPGVSVRRPLLERGFYKINCDKHLWERAWIYVSDNPYTAISDAQGYFTITGIPSGRYSLRAWHEGWAEADKDPAGRVEYVPEIEVLPVTIKFKRTTEIEFNELQPTP